MLKAIKDLRASVTVLEENANIKQTKEIQHLLERQKKLEEVILDNSTAIKRIDDEIVRLKNDKAKAASTDIYGYYQRQQKRKTKDSNIRIVDILKVNWSVDFHIHKTIAKLILGGRNGPKMHAGTDILEYANGIKWRLLEERL